RLAEPPPGGDGALPHPPAPLLEGLRSLPAAGHLSYSALDGYSRCRYRFYVERVVGAASPIGSDLTEGDESVEDVAPEPAELVEPGLGPRERSLAIGNVVHAALEWSARHDWAQPSDADLDSILSRAGLAADAEAAARVRDLLGGWRE